MQTCIISQPSRRNFMRAALLAPLAGWIAGEASGKAQELNPGRIGVLAGDPLARLGLKRSDLLTSETSGSLRFLGKTRYLNDSQAVVTHSIDDSTNFVAPCLDSIDKYGIKATAFINTNFRGQVSEPQELWARLERAIANGHEIGSHSETHPCAAPKPDSLTFCQETYTDAQIAGSRDAILKYTKQPYVWSWAYPCGNCAGYTPIHAKLMRAGYIVARCYPGEQQGIANHPGLQTYAADPYNAAYTQTVQKKGGFSPAAMTDVTRLNQKFDEVYHAGGIYSFVSHPQWLEFGPEGFYERHLAYIGRHNDVWYVPLGPLYAHRILLASTEVRPLHPVSASARFAVYNNLDPKIFDGSITVKFSLPPAARAVEISTGGARLSQRNREAADRWNASYFRREGATLIVTVRPNSTLDFRLIA